MTSDDPSTPSYGEQPSYLPQPGAGAQPPPPGNVPPDPTQQFQPPQPPKKRRTLRITLIVVGSIVGLFIVLAVIGAIVGPKTTPAANHTSTPVTQVPPNVVTTPPPNQYTDSTGGVCPSPEVTNGYCPGDSPSPTPPPPPPPPPPSYNPVTDSQWQLIQENPDGYIGETFTVTGTVTQHDANTGADEFRADAGPADNPNTNTIFDGSDEGSQAAPLQVGQNFTAEVSVEESISYTTTLGGSTTAPELLVVTITQT